MLIKGWVSRDNRDGWLTYKIKALGGKNYVYPEPCAIPNQGMASSSRKEALELQPIPSVASSFSKVDHASSVPDASLGDGIELTSLPKSDNSQTVLRSTTRSSQEADRATTEDTISPERQRTHKRNDRIQFAALCWLVFLVGWNDGTTGPLIPRMQVDYKLDYLIVSLLFVATAIVRFLPLFLLRSAGVGL